VQTVGEEVLFSKAGVFVLPINTLFHLYYLKKTGAKELATGNKMLNMPDLFNYLLTGIARNEYSIITTSSCYNIEEKRFADDILNTLDIDRSIFCETVQPGSRLGPVRKDLAEAAGIPQITVSAVAGHDTASAIAGIPLDTAAGDVYLSLGTWGICGAETDKARLDETARKSGFGNEGGADGGIFLAKNVTGLWIIQQCREQWMRESGKHISWDVIVNEAGKAAAFSSFIDPDDAVFSGAQPKMADTVADYCKKKGQKVPAGIGETSRCVFESLVMRFKENFELLESLRGRPAKKVHLAGGGSKNCLICQWTADALGVPVETGPDEAAVLGNLIMQLKADGEVADLKEGRQIVTNSISSHTYEAGDGSVWDKEFSTFKRIIT
jgi:sugar (pentulose or hexulose) kinase